MTESGPHEFRRIRRFFNRGRCEACYCPESWHPVTGWVRARPLGDKSKPYPQKQFARGLPKEETK